MKGTFAFLLALPAATTTLLSLPEHGRSLHLGPVVHPTPKCWNTATQLFPELSPSIDTIQFCALLPEQDQKRLALEIARCHMLDLGKPLVHGPCHQLEDCLRDLTSQGANAYTHYITYVQQLCIRLTQELLLQQQHQIQVDIGEQYKSVSQETLAQVQNLQQSMGQHVHHLNELADLPQRLRENLSRELEEKLTESLTLSLDRELNKHLATQLETQLGLQLGHLLEQQALHQANFVAGILDNLTVRDQELQERFKLWEHYQTSLWSNHAKEVEKQRRQIEEQRNRMDYLSSTLNQATRLLWPIEGLKAGVQWILRGYVWFETVVTVLVHAVVTVIITRPRHCQLFRIHLFQLIFLEAVIEVMILWMVQNGVAGSATVSADIIVWSLRMGFRVAMILVYVIGVIASFFRKSSHQEVSQRTSDFDLHPANWEMSRNDPVAYYYYPSPPPIPQPVPFTVRDRHLPNKVPHHLSARLETTHVPRSDAATSRYRNVVVSPSYLSPMAPTTTKTMFRGLTSEKRNDRVSSVAWPEEITPPPAVPFFDPTTKEEEEMEDETFFDALDPESTSDRKRKQELLANEGEGEEEEQVEEEDLHKYKKSKTE
ncbi:hypothetical protein FisN_5Lh148 [Fistulifera solaris]|uniref:TRP C-terminal domain-containing protein n=1 Tax=Fistulifera solaris TaxID=1519565 RepID=A0A1Z5JIW0_FISSO|nr:hypothetical protein FisN_5Lh148 [Fistulifera solaris]|eukprot:GAX13945.1 hypothetical protein FisN_5Lh148 [Fistulifera solaris]